MKINVNNVNLNYEEYGTGRPIILLHGNSENITIFRKLIDKLKPDYKVYAIDSRCHGKSENTEKISYDLMAKDVIEFIKQKEIESPILYGFSDGGIIGLKIAIEEPNLLSELIVSGANINPKGMKNMTLFWCKFAYLISKDKLIKMMIDEPNILPSELAKIKIPVHVIAGQKDVIKQKHTMLIANSIKNSTLDIIPNENHGSYIVDSEKIYYIIKKYI